MGEVNEVSDVEAEALVTSTQRLKTKAAEQRRRAEHAARDSSLSSRLCDIRQRSTEANGVPLCGIVTH